MDKSEQFWSLELDTLHNFGVGVHTIDPSSLCHSVGARGSTIPNHAHM